MPRRVTSNRRDGLRFEEHYSWSDCGNFDHSFHLVICDSCKVTLVDEWSCEDPEWVDWHAAGLCQVSLDEKMDLWETDNMADYTDLQEVLDFLTREDQDFDNMWDREPDFEAMLPDEDAHLPRCNAEYWEP